MDLYCYYIVGIGLGVAIAIVSVLCLYFIVNNTSKNLRIVVGLSHGMYMVAMVFLAKYLKINVFSHMSGDNHIDFMTLWVAPYGMIVAYAFWYYRKRL